MLPVWQHGSSRGADNATSREIIGQFPATYRQFVLASSISSSPRPLRIARIM